MKATHSQPAASNPVVMTCENPEINRHAWAKLTEALKELIVSSKLVCFGLIVHGCSQKDTYMILYIGTEQMGIPVSHLVNFFFFE